MKLFIFFNNSCVTQKNYQFYFLMKTPIFLILLFQCLHSFGQVWFDLGFNGSVGTGFYTNEIFYNDKRFNLIPKIGNTASFKLGINASDRHSAVLELGYFKRGYGLNQAFVPNQDDKKVFFQEIDFSGFMGALLYRNTNEGTFIEIGPMWSSIKNQQLTDDINSIVINENVITKQAFRGVFDLRASVTTENGFPFYNYTDKTLNRAIHAIDVQLNFELNISLGFLYRASCGKRSVVFEW